MRNLTTKSDQNSKRVSVLSKMPSYTLTASVTMPRPEMTYSMNVTMKNMTVLSTPSAEQDLTPQSWKQPAKNAGIVERVMTTIKRMMPTVQKTRLTRSEAMSKMSKEIAYQSKFFCRVYSGFSLLIFTLSVTFSFKTIVTVPLV